MTKEQPMRSMLLCAGLVVAMSANDAAAGTPEQDAMTRTKAAIAYDMKDPDSVKFRNVRAALRGATIMVCGEVNAKNSYGAYSGYKPFLHWGTVLMIADSTVDRISNDAMRDTATGLCATTLDNGKTPPVFDDAEVAR